MSYNPSIPASTDQISVSQGQILNNFSALNTIFNADHFTFNYSISGEQGQHRQITFPETQTDPSLSGVIGEIYSKNISSSSEPFFANSNGANVLWRGGSGTGLVSSTTGGNASNGSITFPNGIIAQWGYATIPVLTSTSVTFSVAFPNACFIVLPSLYIATSNFATKVIVVNGSITRTAANLFVNSTGGGSVSVSYLAIGN